VAHEITPHAHPVADWAQWSAAVQRVFDPPGFSCLTDLPTLRTAVLAGYVDARDWWTGPRRHDQRPPRSDYALTRAVAEEVIAERGASADQVDGNLLVLSVAGDWSHLAGPGWMLCSANTTNDPTTDRPPPRATFLSTLEV
jgi:hypothetical protein